MRELRENIQGLADCLSLASEVGGQVVMPIGWSSVTTPLACSSLPSLSVSRGIHRRLVNSNFASYFSVSQNEFPSWVMDSSACSTFTYGGCKCHDPCFGSFGDTRFSVSSYVPVRFFL